jgi:hypothetical protein
MTIVSFDQTVDMQDILLVPVEIRPSAVFLVVVESSIAKLFCVILPHKSRMIHDTEKEIE